MIFSSSPFFLFFSIYLLLHLAIPARYRLGLIIAGSTFFYGYWNPWYVWLPYLLVAVAFLGALWLEQARGKAIHHRRIAIVVCALLVPLIVIKYTNFVYEDVLGFPDRLVTWAFPLGISFITFTMISYVVDVYRGRYPLERRPGLLTGLVLFFPHLIAGPILRPNDLMPQLARPKPAWHHFGIRLVFGFAIFTLGLFKKLVVADTLGASVRAVYEDASPSLSSLDYLLAWYSFCAQIYCDFSGYTDMAIGAAIILGVRLPTNFRQPYAAETVAEYWRRWHITLSTWLRDYIYIPLGGNRYGDVAQIRNLIITMGIGGLWHGAHWTFVVWGLLHGLAISFSHVTSKLRYRLRFPKWARVLLAFHFVCIAFIIFRAQDFTTVYRVMAGPFRAPTEDVSAFMARHMFDLLILCLFFLTHSFDSHRNVRRLVHRSNPFGFWTSVAFIWIFSLAVSQENASKFIYFDF
jgi:alginate O-acetyltransferase complex protein AlgI